MIVTETVMAVVMTVVKAVVMAVVELLTVVRYLVVTLNTSCLHDRQTDIILYVVPPMSVVVDGKRVTR